MLFRYLDTSKAIQKSAIFAFLITSIMCASIYISISNIGPVILGTELNANGHAEHLCLGSGCESYSKMSWTD
jgi:hypothetical protein